MEHVGGVDEIERAVGEREPVGRGDGGANRDAVKRGEPAGGRYHALREIGRGDVGALEREVLSGVWGLELRPGASGEVLLPASAEARVRRKGERFRERRRTETEKRSAELKSREAEETFASRPRSLLPSTPMLEISRGDDDDPSRGPHRGTITFAWADPVGREAQTDTDLPIDRFRVVFDFVDPQGLPWRRELEADAEPLVAAVRRGVRRIENAPPPVLEALEHQRLLQDLRWSSDSREIFYLRVDRTRIRTQLKYSVLRFDLFHCPAFPGAAAPSLGVRLRPGGLSRYDSGTPTPDTWTTLPYADLFEFA